MDVEVLPSETPRDALARVKRRDHSTSALALDIGGQHLRVPVHADDVTALVGEQLYIAFYNCSGQIPEQEDFEGLQGKTDEEEYAMYGRRKRQRTRLLVAQNSSSIDEPLTVERRIAVAPIHRTRAGIRYDGAELLKVKLTFDQLAWVTHVAIGNEKHGVMMAAAFATPIAMKPGNGLTFSINLDEFKQNVALGAGSSVAQLPKDPQA